MNYNSFMPLDERKYGVLAVYKELKKGTMQLRLGAQGMDITAYVRDLLTANKGWHEPTEQSASKFLGTGRKQAIAVGKRVHAAHGIQGMREVHHVIDRILPAGAGTELEAAWNGIGEWRW